MAVAKDQIRQIITENNITSVADVYALLKDSFKDILQELLEAEMDATLGYEKNCKGDLKSDNKRNGHSSKTIKSQYGEFQIDVPRDRNSEFEPKLIPKYQRDISGIEEKVISLYARGMSTRDIHDQLQELYGIELSAEMVSKITDKILPEVKEWQSRPLTPVYPFVFMDCIHYKVREDGRILSRAAYIVLGVTVEGYKEILSITVGANETSKFWLGMLNDLKNRGVQDVLFFCVDGLPGFKDAIQAVFPQAQIQRCVIHMLRNSFKYVNYSDLKKFSADFKHCHKYDYRTELSSQTVDHRKCFPCKVHLHFFADHSIEMQCLIVLLTPGHISAAKLAIGIKFFLFCHAAVFIPSPKKHQRHVLPAVHLLFHFSKVGKFKA